MLMPRKKVLIADDEGDCCDFAREALEPSFEVLTASTGDEALAVARSSRPDLLLLDVKMPGLGSSAITRELKGSPETASIVVLACTGGRSVPEAPYDGYLFKPYRLAQLLSCVESFLR
jgi:CheY-like chemotaxis protein